jgi:hypothetical protein
MNISKEDLAGILFDSINNKISVLDENILIYPAHGAGSACGKNMMKETVDTLANQKLVNYALNGKLNKDEFINELTNDLANPPEYFPSNVMLNQDGYDDFDSILENSLRSISIKDFKNLMQNDDTIILDVRDQKISKMDLFLGLYLLD